MPIPLVTVGLCVRNGAAHVGDAIASLLAQTLPDLRLVVYDNASTDATPEIVRRCAASDGRVRLVRHARDIGMCENFAVAAANAESPFFCWLAADDLREPAFLEVLIDLLLHRPDAALAACQARDVDPDGTIGRVRPDTDGLDACGGGCGARRLAAYLREAPGTPLYGLFRTEAVRARLDLLREVTDSARPLPIGGDVVFLASVLRDHPIAFAPLPLLHFRRGGASHRIDAFGSLAGYLREVGRFARRLGAATRGAGTTARDRRLVRAARRRYLAGFLFRPPMSTMTWHYVARAAPVLERPYAHRLVRRDPAFVRLGARCRALPSGSRMVVFGAGKHTRRCRRALALAAGRGVEIAAICDDAADGARLAPESIDGVPVVPPSRLPALRPDVLLVSSDTYEAALITRARAIAPAGTRVWAIYDLDLEAAPAPVRGNPRPSRSPASSLPSALRASVP